MTISENGRPLGTYAKSAAGLGKKANPVARTIHDPAQRKKWELQQAAASLLRDKRPKTDRHGQEREHYIYRVAMCHRGTDGMAPEIRRAPNGDTASYYGVQTCGSVWHCPICASKVANARRDEMTKAMGRHMANDGRVYLLTYTMQHTAEEGGAGCLVPQLDKLREAMRTFKATRAYKAIMEEAGSIGQIRALEVTFGEANGWHPHVHELAFAAKGALVTDERRGYVGQTIYRKSILGRLRKLWVRHLIARNMAGLKPGDIGAGLFAKLRHLMQRAFTVQCGAYASEYIAKFGREASGWGLQREMTQGHTKTARRNGHCTPWGLLADHMDGDKRAGWLFREYAAAFQGKAQLYWSPGLKKALGVNEVSNEELASAPEPVCTETVIRLTDEQWRVVLSRKARYDVLRVAARDGKFGVEVYLRELAESPPTFSDRYEENGRAFAPLSFRR